MHMDIAIAFLFVLFGLLVGSFLNVVIDRLPSGQSLAYPPSHCPSCNKRLAVKDLVPVLSYALLKGRCRYCGQPIPLRLPLVEAATAVAFGLLFAFFGLSPELAIALFYFCLLLVIAVIDLEQQLIMNWLVYPAAPIATAFSLLAYRLDIVPDITHAAIGCAIGLVLFLLIAILSRGGMGLGDVKMAALMGIMLGYPSVLVAIFLAIVAGGIVAIVLLATREKGRKQAIPFGPFLALGTMLALLWGNSIWGWYARGFS
ncbi:MAG: prepilin peptidase [Dehalococcoidia bacterium]|nr:MAG: prepilin peptidase [Dehalococcoidia bacterium]